MTITNHALAGALVAAAIAEPSVALPAALISHFVLDMVPHWNYRVPKGYLGLAIALDCLLACSLLAAFIVVGRSSVWLILVGGFLGVLPDLTELPHVLHGRKAPRRGSNWLHRFRRFHSAIQWSETSGGLWMEVFWLLGLVSFVLLLG